MWDYTGMHIEGRYIGVFPVSGRVELSRVKYGGTVSHHVVLDSPITVFGAERDRVIISHSEITRVRD